MKIICFDAYVTKGIFHCYFTMNVVLSKTKKIYSKKTKIKKTFHKNQISSASNWLKLLRLFVKKQKVKKTLDF